MTHRKKSLNPSERRLKVYGKYLPRAWHGYVLTPEIRLCGKWLQEAGFECGDEVTVKCLANKLEITLNPVDEPEPIQVQKRRYAKKQVFDQE
ncbi:SymE family type I addiction module toxin [Dyadobacter jiangsuensis]